MRGATGIALDQVYPLVLQISIHAPHAGRDRRSGWRYWIWAYFNPRAPCGARREHVDHYLLRLLFQSTRPMRGATRRGSGACAHWQISIHAPHAGRDLVLIHWLSRSHRFQSTRPMRGATRGQAGLWQQRAISIHAPHAGRDRRNAKQCQRRGISIHAPHAGRDQDPGAIL